MIIAGSVVITSYSIPEGSEQSGKLSHATTRRRGLSARWSGQTAQAHPGAHSAARSPGSAIAHQKPGYQSAATAAGTQTEWYAFPAEQSPHETDNSCDRSGYPHHQCWHTSRENTSRSAPAGVDRWWLWSGASHWCWHA